MARELKEAVEEIKAGGTTAIPCDNLINYLNDILKSPPVSITEAEKELYKAQLQLAVLQAKIVSDQHLEMFKSVIHTGQNALRAGFLLNGGAAVALLAFISHLATTQPTRVAVFASCLWPFVVGVFLIALASFTTYLSQWFYAEEGECKEKIGFWLNIVTIFIGFGCVVAFLWGMHLASVAFGSFG